jgi:hypothetical protein
MSIILRGEYSLKKLENMVLRRIFGYGGGGAMTSGNQPVRHPTPLRNEIRAVALPTHRLGHRNTSIQTKILVGIVRNTGRTIHQTLHAPSPMKITALSLSLQERKKP